MGELHNSNIETEQPLIIPMEVDNIGSINDANDVNLIDTVPQSIGADVIEEGSKDVHKHDETISNESSNGSTLTNARLKTKKKLNRVTILESDSESDAADTVTKDYDEEANLSNLSEAEPRRDKVSSEKNTKKRNTIFDSDSDDTEDLVVSENTVKTKPTIADSDSEEETANVPDTSSVRDETSNLLEASRLTAICDPESSEDEEEVVHSDRKNFNKKALGQPKKEKPPKKMTAKDALKQRQEITSESQRMFRELPLSLPYHKPKERSIREFLQSRPRLSVIKNETNLRPAVAIKMTTDELKMVVKKMEDRKKELEKFYKSESEEEEDERNASPPLDNNTDDTDVGSLEKGNGVTETTIDNHSDDNTNDNAANLDNLNTSLNTESNQLGMCTNLVDKCEDIKQGSLGVESKDQLNTSNINNNEMDVGNHEIDAVTESTNVFDNLISIESSSDLILPTDNEMIVTENLNVTEKPLIDDCEKPTISDNSKSLVQNKIIVHSIVSIPNAPNGTEESVDYVFNLDDIEEIDHGNNEEKRHRQLLNDDMDHNEISNFKQQLFKQLENSKPSLSGDFDQEIDLDDGTIKPNPIAQLQERFVKHLTAKKTHEEKVKLDVINFSQGEIHKETLTIPVEDKGEESTEASFKPGGRLQTLRNELQEKIAKERADLWKQKDFTLNIHEGLDTGETSCKDGYEADEDILDDEEEELMSDDTTDEEEDVFDETNHVEKVRKKSVFVNDEAEDTDELEGMGSGRSSKVSNPIDDENSNRSDSVPIHKKTSRILKGFTEDSDDDLDELTITENRSTIQSESEDEIIPPHQPQPDKTPRRERTQSNPDDSFHTPIMQLTALQNLNSGSKYLHESPISPFQFPTATPSQNHEGVKQKLFVDSYDPVLAENTKDLAELCSGKFSSYDNSKNLLEIQNLEPNTQDLLSICSGGFSGLTNKKESHPCDIDEKSEKIEALINSDAKESSSSRSITESRFLDEDRIISQLLNEEELEQFKKKFESPIAEESNVDMQSGGKLVFDSSDDECSESQPIIAKTHHRKLHFSDEESEETEVDNEEINLHDNVEEDDDVLDGEDKDNLYEDEKGNSNEEVDYDSEENEIGLRSVHTSKHVLTDFVENEAELSESEWDSADEDERNLDELEVEQGDADVFDDDKIKNDLEKIHMQRILDEDNREIKILQEMLLEDGELHGTGRERQFRWRNIDDNANDDRSGPVDGDDVYLDDDESEEQWRRARYEREMFLKSQQENQNGESDLDVFLSDSNSQVFKMGQEAFQRSLSNSNPLTEKRPSVVQSSTMTNSSVFSNTRGSFLARTDKFLTRLADITKVSSTLNIVKTSKKIVFKTSSITDENDVMKANNKRKATDGTPAAIKKLRLTSNLSPSIKIRDKKKKLF